MRKDRIVVLSFSEIKEIVSNTIERTSEFQSNQKLNVCRERQRDTTVDPFITSLFGELGEAAIRKFFNMPVFVQKDGAPINDGGIDIVLGGNGYAIKNTTVGYLYFALRGEPGKPKRIHFDQRCHGVILVEPVFYSQEIPFWEELLKGYRYRQSMATRFFHLKGFITRKDFMANRQLEYPGNIEQGPVYAVKNELLQDVGLLKNDAGNDYKVSARTGF